LQYESISTEPHGQILRRSFVWGLFAVSVATLEPGDCFAQHRNADAKSVDVVGVFAEIHDGWSCDEVLLQDDLYSKFIAECSARFPDSSSEDCAWALLNARKAGRLANHPATKRIRLASGTPQHVAEMAARFLEDKHKASMDRVLCSPALRSEFDRVAASMAPDVAVCDLRRAALGLRKARKLKPELVLRIADWDRDVLTFSLSDLLADAADLPDKPGVYLFRDPSGYLYIGESKLLSMRIKEHLDRSDKSSLINLFASHSIDLQHVQLELHAFGSDTRASEVRIRRAYESELIASRKPKFNIRP
jgi:hypothetical protein